MKRYNVKIWCNLEINVLVMLIYMRLMRRAIIHSGLRLELYRL